MDVEFSDRYGERMPSWLRGCHGDCEAMGWVPIKHGEAREPWASLWRAAEAEEPSDDGYHFVRCPQCSGTGRVSVFTSITRIPVWAFRAARQTWQFTRNPDYFVGDQGFLRRLSFSLYVCFWLDIARLRN